jgi:hypothetical protein
MTKNKRAEPPQERAITKNERAERKNRWAMSRNPGGVESRV